MGRTWTEKENKIIEDNYPTKGSVIVVNLLRCAGIPDRDAFAVVRQASKLNVKRIGKRRKGRLVKT